MSNTNVGYYDRILKAWPKLSGDKPTHDMLATAHGLGCRPGVQALYIAMTLRPAGSTVQQFMAAGSCGPANNKRRQLITDKLITVKVEGKPYAHISTLTAKGKAAVEAFIKGANDAAADEKPVKAKAKRKAKAKAEPVVADAPVAVPVIEPVTETPVEATA